jgi:hypothetical protein
MEVEPCLIFIIDRSICICVFRVRVLSLQHKKEGGMEAEDERWRRNESFASAFNSTHVPQLSSFNLW